MLAYPIATAAFLLLLGHDADAASTPKQKMEFMRAMNSKQKKSARRLSRKDQNDFQATLHGNSKRSAALRKKVIKKSTVVTSPEERKLDQNYNNYNNNANQANGNYNNANANNNAYSNNANAKDGSDDYFAATGEWENVFGFDATQYSLSYHGCASVRQFDDQVAAQEDTTSVFATKRFAVFRFCPEKTCMGIQEEECDEETFGQEYCEMISQQEEFSEEQEAYQQAEAYNNGNAYAQAEEEVLYGARGKGCQSNYGEYMIEMEEYLALMLEYQEERFQTYCEYCEECMYSVYQQWIQDGGQNRHLVEFDDFKNSNEHRNLGGDDDNVNANFYKVCPEYDTCAEYSTMCKQEVDDHLTEYFECTKTESNNGQVAYIAPHCAKDGFSVTLGVYSDEYCNEYIGDGVDISNFIGEEIDVEEDALKTWYNSANGALDILEYSNDANVCIPCRKGDNPYEESDYVVNDDDQMNINYDETEINEICENLYEVSARCDKNFRSYTTKSKQAKFAEAIAQEDLTCDFIDSIVMGNYNENGFVNLGDNYNVESQPGWLKDNMYAQEYGHYITEVTPLQIFGLLASLVACGILAVWSMTLHKSVSKRGPWRPKRGLNRIAEPSNAADIDRQSSGIVMGRSQTDASYYMS
mmetsp:Transcript_14683/g.25875  ORF Transcript_14683/g.25875 Transcript_14683/m.25875 type:complete len:640 (-) Transcript_14683:208-2127(-)|eukprot:CAMPEP_0201883934 /NCGR_PEP_ID=MMETSP0902-20130614/16313_1 /ASSEMBLY_ACC=CAM_ASM_000551 /TAXON_ID=420261 /ORGANISM="Thalassiosira antarctica, Strain CCMP982" /LENGTH=639 /DNA_ID=CAMNT_0048412803 /DNA_START=161 /DNA_END=2080 /DNA_ORIENTATION=+